MNLSDKLRNAANRTTRLNADVALLCEAALYAAIAFVRLRLVKLITPTIRALDPFPGIGMCSRLTAFRKRH